MSELSIRWPLVSSTAATILSGWRRVRESLISIVAVAGAGGGRRRRGKHMNDGDWYPGLLEWGHNKMNYSSE